MLAAVARKLHKKSKRWERLRLPHPRPRSSTQIHRIIAWALASNRNKEKAHYFVLEFPPLLSVHIPHRHEESCALVLALR